MRGFLLALIASAALVAPLSAQDAQQSLRESQARLDSIRAQRARLQAEMDTLSTRVRDASRELDNIARQRTASAAVVRELDFQAAVLLTNVETTQYRLEETRARLSGRSTALRERLRSIYKRGPLHAVRVLLSAENFGDLLTRYKYLNLITSYDRLILDDVRRLEAELAAQEQELSESLAQLETLRQDKEQELTSLQRLVNQRDRTLRQYRQAQTVTQERLRQLARDEASVTGLIARLEEERRREGGSREGTVTTRSLGSLSWPVEGDVIYRFGPERRPNGIALRNNGIGIAAAPGTPVRAVEGGDVVLARPFEGYGPTVMVNHGGGYYTLYMYLKSISVREGQTVSARQVVGTVGGEQTPEGAHIEFQVRAPVRAGGVAEAVDPLAWLRQRGR